MQLSKDEVLHIAKLARIALTKEEVDKFQKQLSSIVDFISELKQVNVEGVEPTAQVTGLVNVVRGDFEEKCDAETVYGIIQSFPDKKGRFMKVPPVFGEE